MKKIPMRSCVVTREKLPKNELIRVVRGTDGSVFVDFTSKANGRGAYIKADLEVLDKAIKNKILERHLEVNIPDSVYEEIRNYVNNK